MAKYRVSVGRERALDAEIEVDAANAREAEAKALGQVADDDFHEGDWEGEPYVTEVLELADND